MKTSKTNDKLIRGLRWLKDWLKEIPGLRINSRSVKVKLPYFKLSN